MDSDTIQVPLTDRFVDRHVGPRPSEIQDMLDAIGVSSIEELVEQTIPEAIRLRRDLDLDENMAESEVLATLACLADENHSFRSFIGMGYYDTITPPVIQRSILENPGWYTQYTPYQAEIAQGRLEALLNFQTVVSDLTGFEIANASLLDEGTAAAEAMTMFHSARRGTNDIFFVSAKCHPQTIEVVKTRATRLSIEVVVGDESTFEFAGNVFGALLQYPTTDGLVEDYTDFCASARANGSYVVAATDLLALTLLRPPAEFGVDCAVGSSQRFGVPLGYGGPHAAFFATREEFKRRVPGRLIGVSVDSNGKRALRMALQTREQHIRREKATSNICTAQVLLAIMAGMYAVYHGPVGLSAIARRIHQLTNILAEALRREGHVIRHTAYFDTLKVGLNDISHSDVRRHSEMRGINVRYFDDGDIGISLDQATTEADVADLIALFNGGKEVEDSVVEELAGIVDGDPVDRFARTTEFMTHDVFHSYQSETDMLRYLHKLESRDLSLNTSMIPLGSCTMKLNAAAQMMSVTLPGFAKMHPFAPVEQTQGYQYLFKTLESWLAEITGFSAVSLQPNSGAQGELTGLLVIAAYHESRGETQRKACLIPSSAHGTNPASAVMAGMDVVIVKCDDEGNVDVDDLRAKAEAAQGRSRRVDDHLSVDPRGIRTHDP